MKPFTYQAEAVDVTVSSLRERKQALVIMATGLGKTFVAASSLRSLKRGRKQFRNLVLCHDTDILEQSEPTFRAILGETADIGFFTGETKEGSDADVVFSTFQTMREWKGAFFPDEFGLVTVDEAHHSQAMTYKDVIEYFSGASLLGLTAMRDRMDGKDIADIFGKPVVSIPLEEAIARGLLTPFEYRIVSDGLNTGVIRALTRDVESGKRFTLADVNKRLFIEARDDEIVRRVMYEAGPRKTLVFCRNIRHANRIAEMIGPLAQAYHSGGTRAVNRDTLKAFRAGAVQFLVAVNKANEGVDVPDAEVVVFLRTTDSKTVFFQQLGRSLRKLPGKKRALILDFVGNVERIVMLQDVIRKIAQNLDLFENEEKELVSVSGANFEFNFSETIVEMLELVRIIRRDFYPTWQEASVATIHIKIPTQEVYRVRYKEDSRLPAKPEERYQDFPNWYVFLGKRTRSPYPTWQEASAAAIRLGITTVTEYRTEGRYKEDNRLPVHPHQKYADFPGWTEFLGHHKQERYATWEEAAEAARALGIQSSVDWRNRKLRQRNPRLPSYPDVYEDFPGWSSFSTNPMPTNNYPTWEEASTAAKKLGFKSGMEYRKRYREDSRLPSTPRSSYQNFPGWRVFLGKEPKKNFYPTWKEAADAIRRLGIKGHYDYRAKYKQDARLPGSLPRTYNEFPGWIEFLRGKKRKTNG